MNTDDTPPEVAPRRHETGGRFAASLRVIGASLADRQIRWVLIAFTCFGVAEWVRWIGLLVYGFDKGGAAGAGLISMIQLVPAALVIPFASGLSDRFERTRVLIASYLVAGLGTGGAGFAMMADAPFLVVSILAAVGLVGVTMIRPTVAALLPQLVGTPEELTAANVTSELILSGSLLVGPVIASLVLGASGATAVVVGGGALLLVGAVCMLRVRPSGSPTAPGSPVRMLGGFLALAHDHASAWIVGLVVLQAVAWGAVDVLLVSLVIDELGLNASAVGVFSAALGIGALVGGLATVSLVGRRRLAPPFAFGVIVWSVPLLIVGVAGLAPVIVVLLAAAGIGLSFVAVVCRTLLQRVVDDDMLGRVFGLLEAGFMAAWAIGSALAPMMLAAFGLGWAFVLAAAALPLLTLAAWSSIVRADREAIVPMHELALLRGIEMFALLPEPTLERLARNVANISVPAGTAIIREGEPGDLFYVLDAGTVQVTIADAEVAAYGPGEYFGEIALLRDMPRQASVTAVTDTDLATLDREHFLAALTGSVPAGAAADREIDRRLGGPRP
jgi:MFS family permease